MPLEPSTTENQPSGAFGQYQLIEKIAQGGMAEIFKGQAMDAQGLERPVVIKRILPHIAASPEFVEMLIDEAKIAVMLSHGNIAQIYDLGKVADDYFIVMEYVEGKTLSQMMKRLKTQGKLMPVAYAVYCCREIAAALDYMHRKTDDEGHPLHIIHRDISPQNAILSTAGTIKIIDFGIAKAKTKISTTDSGVLKGKFAYMSPEHAEGMKLDHRTDIFSLGVILFELLTGQRLFKGKTNMETVKRVKKAKVPAPSGIRSAIPKALDKIVFKALQKDREKRYASALDLEQDLTRFLLTHYPEFSPHEMVSYLQSLFPEIAPQERTIQEETPIADKKGPMIKPPGGEWSSKEDTVNADSEILRRKHKESEVFEVEGTQRTDSSSLEMAEIAPRKLRISYPAKAAAAVIAVLALTFAAWGATRHFIQRKQRAAAERPSPEVIQQLKAREELLKKKALAETKPITAPAKAVDKSSTGRSEEREKPKIPQPQPQAPTIPPKAAAPKTESAKMGTVAIDSNPPGASIYRNDIDTGHKTPFVFDNLNPGSQRFGLTLEGYRFWEGQADLKGGDKIVLRADLAPNFGSLQINSAPAGAQVSVNGKPAGLTPLLMDGLAPKTLYEITITQDGYEDWKGSAKIFGGKTETVTATLRKKTPSEE